MPRKILQENPRQNPLNFVQQNPRHMSAEWPAQQLEQPSAAQPGLVHSETILFQMRNHSIRKVSHHLQELGHYFREFSHYVPLGNRSRTLGFWQVALWNNGTSLLRIIFPPPTPQSCKSLDHLQNRKTPNFVGKLENIGAK